jgi:hypothetical protein
LREVWKNTKLFFFKSRRHHEIFIKKLGGQICMKVSHGPLRDKPFAVLFEMRGGMIIKI